MAGRPAPAGGGAGPGPQRLAGAPASAAAPVAGRRGDKAVAVVPPLAADQGAPRAPAGRAVGSRVHRLLAGGARRARMASTGAGAVGLRTRVRAGGGRVAAAPRARA